MPIAPKTYRPAHAVSAQQHARQQHDRSRGSASARGYGTRWQKYRRWFLSHPVNAICGICERASSEVIDHVTAVSGADDPLFWEPENHLAMCRPCHQTKTLKCDGGFGNKRTEEGEAILERLKETARHRAAMMRV